MKLPSVGLVMVSAALACSPGTNRGPAPEAPTAARVAASSSSAVAHHPERDAPSPKVRLKGFVLDVLEPAPAIPFDLDVPQVAHEDHAAKRPAKWIVQLQGPVGPEHHRDLAALGARAVEYVPEHAVIVAMDDHAAERVKGLGAVRGAIRLRPAYKIDAGLKDERGAVARWDGRRRLAVRLDDGDGIEPAVSEVHRSRGRVLHVSRGLLTIDVPSSAVARLARLESVTWIEEVPELRLLNDTTSWTIQTFRAGDRAVWDHGLRGRGQIVGMGDSGIDHDMCFFRDPAGSPIGPTHRKVAGYDSFGDLYDGNMGHGTHVAGTVAGDQSPVTGSTAASGMAPEARLYLTDLSPGDVNYVLPPADLGELFVAPYLAGARLHTNSWGANSNVYDSYAWSADRFAWEHKEFLPLFANGNAGPTTGTVGTPATAKNVLSVGAASNGADAGDVASFSSHGPAADGRTKPTLMAPGVSIASADSDGVQGSNNCGTTTMSGTSMATPAVAGVAALVRQYYVEGYFPFGVPSPAHAREPSAALVKATLVNSAQSMGGAYVDAPIPSTGQGWGRVELDTTLRFAGDPRYLEVFDVQEGLQTGAAWTESFFASGERPFKVTLVWTDYPASGLAELALVNDLDLLVTAPDGATRYAGNAFAAGASVSGGAADRLNVEEQVLVAAPQRGRYTVTVTAHQVPFGPQPFALVVTGGAGVTGEGFVGLDKARYGASDTLHVEVSDADPNVDPALADTLQIDVACGDDVETVALVESGPDSGVFVGTVPASAGVAVAGDGVLQLVDGATIAATYHDADDGTGAPADTAGTAIADLTPPLVSSVAATEVRQGSAVVSWSTSEPASGAVEYGTEAALGESRATPWLTTGHRIQLTGLREATEYRFAVAATDEAGNVARDTNGGAFYRFTTPSEPPELTVYSSNSTSTFLGETVIFGIASDPSGVTSVLVNDRAATYRPGDGYYELAVPLAMGENPFVVVARDGLGNVATVGIVVTRNPPPDLTVGSVTGPARGGIGERVHVDDSVCNVGQGVSPGSGVVMSYLSTDETISPETDVALGGLLLILDDIAPGECVPFSLELLAPLDATLVGKTFYLGTYVDVSNEIYEANEANNALAGTRIVLEGPDLAVSGVSAPTAVDAGVEFAVSVAVANVGLGASSGFAVAVYLSRDPTITVDDLRLASGRPSLGGGRTLSLTYRAVVGSDVPPGEYYVGAIADPGNEIAEPDEADNARAGNRVVVRGANLVATAVDGPATASGASEVTFTATVAERGGAGTGLFSVGLYLSTDGTIDRTDRRIGGFELLGLAAGAVKSVPVTVTLPADLAPGTYRLGVIVDERDEVKESDETDNALAGGSLRIAGADLLVTAVSGPGVASPGRAIDVTTTVAASPAGAAATGFYVGIYLSSDTTITPSDTLLGIRWVAGLEPGAQSTASTTVTVPSLPEGTYHLGAIADVTVYVCDWESDLCWWVVDAVKETDETNNASTGSPLFVGTRADLVVSAVAGPATSQPGGSLVVSTTVTNVGNAAAASSRAGIYLSRDAAVGAGDVLIGTLAVPALAPGAASTAQTPVLLPADAAGTWWLGAVADLDGAVAEASETNNAGAATTTLVVSAPGLPNLAVTAVTGPGAASRGQIIAVTVVVANGGVAPAAASTAGVYLTADGSVTTSDVLIARVAVGPLDPGASRSVTATAAVPATLLAGAYYVGAYADVDAAVTESNEADNALAGTRLNVKKTR